MSRHVRISGKWSIAGACVIGLALTGCVAERDTAADPTPSSTVSARAEDGITCDAFGDVVTIVDNADAGLAEQRMEAQERDGWYRVATRVLDRIPTRGTGDVHDAIEELREAAPAVKLGAVLPVGIGSTAWVSGWASLTEACAAQGFDMASEAFTRG